MTVRLGDVFADTFTEKHMNTTQQRMTAIFNEWARRYAENPDDFRSILDEDGNPVADYGECCARYFEKIAAEMDAEGLLPTPASAPAAPLA